MWDSRSGSTAPASSTLLNGGNVVMDMEIHQDKDTIIAASGKQVFLLSLSTLAVVKTFDMPSPMNFLEEGGVSLSPDGSKFLTVRLFFFIFFVILSPISSKPCL